MFHSFARVSGGYSLMFACEYEGKEHDVRLDELGEASFLELYCALKDQVTRKANLLVGTARLMDEVRSPRLASYTAHQMAKSAPSNIHERSILCMVCALIPWMLLTDVISLSNHSRIVAKAYK